MALYFTCDKCQKIMTSQFLKIGEKASCKNCGAEIIIPNSAVDDTHNTTNKIQDNDSNLSMSEIFHIISGNPTNKVQNNDSNYTLIVLNVFAWLDLIGGISLGYYLSSNNYIFAALAVAQGIFAYAVCQGFIILIENSQKQTELLKKIANK